MSLIDAITNVAEEAGYTVGATAVGSTDVTALQLLSIANRIIREMADAYPWRKLWKSGTISLVNGTASYALPSDFSHFHFDTFWNQSDMWRIVGPIAIEEYAAIRGYGDIPEPHDKFLIRGVTSTELLISPTPSASATAIFEYLAARPVRPQTWALGLSLTAGDYVFYNGNYYSADTTHTTSGNAPTHTTGAIDNLRYYSGAYDTFLSDTDEPVLPQRILEQGMLERFGEIHGLTVVPRYEMQLHEAYGKEVQAKTLYAGGFSYGPFQEAFNERVRFGGG